MTSSVERRDSGARRLATQSAVYAVGNAVIKASGLLLAPLYLNTTLLPRAAYGQLGLLEITGQLCILTAGLGLTSAMIRLSSDPGDPDAARAPGTALVGTAVSGLAMFGLFWLLAAPIAKWLLDDIGHAGIVRVYGLYVALQTMLAVPYGFIRLRERAALFVVARLSEIAFLIAGVFYFLAVRGLGLRGVVYAFVLSSAVAVVTLVVGMASRLDLSVSWSAVKRMLRYGAPLALGGLAMPILHAGDRYILDYFRGAEVVGVYYWGSRLSGLLNMLFVQSVSMAFGVVGVKALTGSEIDVSLHRRAFRHFTVWAGWAVLALSLFAYEITALLTADTGYPTAAPLVLPLSLGYLFYGHFVVFSNTLLASGRTHLIASAVVFAAAANVAMNLVLIPQIGIYGAAVATVLSYFLLAMVTAFLSRREYDVGYAWKDSIVVIVVVCLLYYGADNATQDPTARFVLRVAAVLMYMPLIVVARVYRAGELRDAFRRMLGFVRSVRSG